MDTDIDGDATNVYKRFPMLPKPWRNREDLAQRDVAKKLGISAMAVHNYETGRRDAPNSVAQGYEKISKGDVTAEDLNRVRRKYLAKQQDEEEGNPGAVAV